MCVSKSFIFIFSKLVKNFYGFRKKVEWLVIRVESSTKDNYFRVSEVENENQRGGTRVAVRISAWMVSLHVPSTKNSKPPFAIYYLNVHKVVELQIQFQTRFTPLLSCSRKKRHDVMQFIVQRPGAIRLSIPLRNEQFVYTRFFLCNVNSGTKT